MKYLIAAIALTLGLGVGAYFSEGIDFFKRSTSTHISSTVKETLPISEYASLAYHYTDVITHSDAIRFWSFGNIPLTEKRAIYTIDGTIKLGFDGKEISVENSDNSIIVHMPGIKILSHEIYPETFNLYDEKTGLFNRYSLKDANEIQMTQKIERERKVAEDAGLFSQARESAEQMLKPLLESLPEIKRKYTIIFEWEDL